MSVPVVEYMNYRIYFTDRAEYDAAVATYGFLITTPPASAAALFGLPYPTVGGPFPQAKGLLAIFPFDVDPPGSEIFFPLPTGVIADPTINGILVPGYHDPLGSPLPDGIFYWVGIFSLFGGGAAQAVPTAALVALPQRRWHCGFELPNAGETGQVSGGGSAAVSRDSSRTGDGMGLCIRGNSTAQSYTMRVTNFTGGGSSTLSDSWERYYIRLRQLPTSTQRFWRCHAAPSASSGAALEMTTGGAIHVSNIDLFNTTTVIGTSPVLTMNTWYRIDILIKYNALGSGGSGSIRIYFNGALVVSATVAAATGGLGENSSKHQSSVFGPEAGSTFGLELDVDDWVNSDIPTASGSENLTSLDWLSGSHIQRINPTASGPGTTNWTGDYRVTLENPSLAAIGTLTSNVSGAPLEIETDAEAGPLAQFGAASICVGMYSSGSAAGAAVTGQLGYSLAGGATVLAAISQPGFGTFGWQAVMYRPTGLVPIDPPPYPPNSPKLPSVFPIVLEHTKAATADAAVVKMFQATVEYIGAWGIEDGTIHDPAVPPLPPSTGVHNAPYPQYALSMQTAGPVRAVVISAGTYIGNSLGQDIALTAPANWLWVRRVTGSSTGANQWHSSGIAATVRYLDRMIPDVLVRAILDANGNASMQVSGADAQVNLSGETYQYVAVSDPGMRFMICGAYMHGNTVPNPSTEVLVDNTFTPDAAFLSEQYVNQTTSLPGYWYKGPGYAPASAQRLLSVTPLTNQLTFGLGLITTQDQLHPQQANGVDGQVSYAVFRMVDGSGDPGVVFQILSYTGDGSGPRTITLTPTSLRWPLFVEVVSHGATGWFRDPSHTGSDSSTVTGSIVTNAITGVGVDLITVGSAANQLNVIYDIFAIPGAATGATNGTYVPVAPISTPSPVFPATPPAPQPPPPVGCHDDWGTARPDGLPYIPLSPP